MLLPINWLKDFVKIDENPEELSKKLTMSGSNVERIEHWGREIKKIVIGKLEKVENHPNADKLLITQVNTGSMNLQIVTGAKNIKEGDKVPVALHGSTISGGKKIRTSKLRGVESEGMLCSAEELGLDSHGLPENMKNGILILPADAPLGVDIKEYLKLEDTVFDFEITPNRPDCLSVIGIARETAAVLKKDFHMPKIELKEEGEDNSADRVSVTVEAEDLCLRYVARIVKDVVIKPSPLWMQRRLQLCGVRPINNIVDITNYVMLEMGQPLHAFDLDKLEGHSIIVRRAKSKEKIRTLDGVERDLDDSMLVIADKKNPVAIAGVMGGADSEITSSTKNILLESANFFGPNIRRTSRQLGLRSESSARFEKGLDPYMCAKAADRACELIEQLCAGKVVKGRIDVFPGKTQEKIVEFDPDRINRVLGTEISFEEMKEILSRLEISVRESEKGIKAVVPTFRADIKEEADIVEEIARIYGYDRLPVTLPKGNVTFGKLKLQQKYASGIKDILVHNGFSEIYTYSFISPKALDNINVPCDSTLRKAIMLQNPLGEEHSMMRTTLLPNMLDTIAYNLNHKVSDIKVFEMGAVYIPDELPLTKLPSENKHLSIGLCDESVDFYDLKRVIETLFTKLRIEDYKFSQEKHFAFHTGRCAKISVGDEVAGYAGEIHPDVLENYGIGKRVYAAELNLDVILSNASNKIRFKPLPRFPASERDLAVVVKERILAGDILDEIRRVSGKLLENVEIFDIYTGDSIPAGCRSIAFSLKFRAADKTLTDDDVNKVMEKIIWRLSEEFEAVLRE